MSDPFRDARNPLVRTMDRISRDTMLYAERAKVARLRGTLVAAKEKLGLYRAQHSGEYVGGVQYHELMRQIDEILNETRC